MLEFMKPFLLDETSDDVKNVMNKCIRDGNYEAYSAISDLDIEYRGQKLFNRYLLGYLSLIGLLSIARSFNYI